MTTSSGQDAAVAVLQQQQQSLEASMRELSKTTAEGFASMAAKMERLTDLTITITQMSARQEAHGDGLSRAFGELKSIREAVERMGDENGAWRENYARTVDDRFASRDQSTSQYLEHHAHEHREIDKRWSFARGWVLGVTITGAALISLLTWAASTYIGETRANTEKIHQLELKQRAPNP